MDTAAIPHPPRRLPVLGHVVGLNPRTPVQSSLRLLRDLGPISVREVFSSEIVTVGGADLAAELNDDTRFGKHVAFALSPLRLILGDALFTAQNDEPNWQLAHDILVPAFTRDAMRGYHTIMLDVSRELLTRWDAAADRGQRVDVTADMTRLTFGGFWQSSQHVPSRAESLVRVERSGIGSVAGAGTGRHAHASRALRVPAGPACGRPLTRGTLRPWGRELRAGRWPCPPQAPAASCPGGRSGSARRAYAANRWPISSMGLR